MRTLLTISLHGKWNENAELCLWGTTAAGESLSPLELKLQLFSADRASFYGAFAETWEEGPLGGVKLSAEEALRFLCHPSFNPLLAVEWAETLLPLREAAGEINEAAQRGLLVPTVHPNAALVNWKLAVDESEASFPRLAAMLQHDPVIDAWVSAIMAERLERDPEKREALRRMEQWLRGRASDSSAHSDQPAVRERDLLRLSGWSSSDLPFAAGFRLDDPRGGEDRSEWTLTFVLIDRAQPALIVDCDRYGIPNAMISDWPDAADSAASLLSAWLHAVPFLQAEDEGNAMRTKLNDEQAWMFLTSVSGEITDWGGTVLLPSWWNRVRSVRPKLKAQLQPGIAAGEPSLFGLEQMLDFDWKLALGDVELSEEEFLSIAGEQKPLHFVRGEWIALDQSLVERIKKVMDRSKRKKGIPLRDVLLHGFGKRDAGEEDSLLEDLDPLHLDWEVETSGNLLRWMQRLERSEQVPQITVSNRFQGSLRGYQLEGLSWLVYLRQFGLGGCLADDMGLGKTIQYIAYLLHIKENEPASGPSLLICPTSLVGNWQKELERFAPTLKLYVHYGAGRIRDAEGFRETVMESDLVVTTYMTAMLDIESLLSLRWQSLCVDEAQNIKNAYTKQASAIRRLSADHRIAMTGTPVENRISELWSIIDFINPGFLGTLPSFERQYGRLAERNKAGAAEQLRRLVRPFMLRRMKSDPRIVPDLPEKLEAKVFVPLTKEQAALYENVLDRLFGSLEQRKGIDRRGSILAALTQLKQICDHPALFTKENTVAATSPRHSHKASRLVEMVSEVRAEGERCLIFTQYVEMGALLQRMLERALKEPVLYLHGGTTKLQRDQMVERFNAPSPNSDTEPVPGIFVLSLKAGGTGLNLTAASHVFHYDRWWNPAVENQATDRAYRIGQKRLVQVHKFVALGTLEERIDEMIEKKQSLSRQIIDSGENWITELSTNELEELFALRRSWLEEG